MSQEKVDRYKKEKANRKQTMKREKMANVVRKCVVAVCGLLLVAWIGYSAYDIYDSGKEPQKIQIDYQSFDTFAQDVRDAGAADAAVAEEAAQE